MAIVIRILSLLVFCSFCSPAQSLQCRAGEEIVRQDTALESLTINGPCRVTIRRVTFKGARQTNPQTQPLPPADRRFADHYQHNGLLLIGAAEAVIEDSQFSEMPAFAILASGVKNIRISRCTFRNSGSTNPKGRNNTTGGVLLEDGTSNFTVENSTFESILGNALWTHSRYRHPRNGPGVFRRNTFNTIGRDAIQVGHAFNVTVIENIITRIGYPIEAIDFEGGGTPVGIDTSGNVDSTHYTRNQLTEINGKCFDLDGFHHGSLTGNTCVNKTDQPYGHYGIVMNNTNPDMEPVGVRIEDNRFDGMRYGGIFIIGSGHIVRKNVLTRLHTAHCSEAAALPGCTHFEGEPDLLRTGIYFGKRAERPAVTRGNRLEGNTIRGWRMDRNCIGFAPGVDKKDNRIIGNICGHSPN